MEIMGHGIDLVSIARIAEMLDEHGERFTHRCFTGAERAYADAAGRRRAERYAARFAAKEAALKALGTGLRDGIHWTDISIERRPDGRPELAVSGRFAELADQRGIRRWLVSLSHAEGEGGGAGFAIGSVLAIG
jgi:holo-[acyl-carrier protein] synthase